jgi:hypothetical protein
MSAQPNPSKTTACSLRVSGAEALNNRLVQQVSAEEFRADAPECLRTSFGGWNHGTICCAARWTRCPRRSGSTFRRVRTSARSD